MIVAAEKQGANSTNIRTFKPPYGICCPILPPIIGTKSASSGLCVIRQQGGGK